MVDPRLRSIHGLYMAMARGEVSGFTVPAFNLRGMTEELAQGIFEAAKETDTGAMILEIARSEMGYTGQLPDEFVRRVLIGADRASWNKPIFIQGDHSQAKASNPGVMVEGELEKIKKLIDVEIEAGFFNIDIDASTLVNNALPTVREQQMVNAEITAELSKYIRAREPQGETISIGGEIGHIGDKNSTSEDLNEFMRLYREKYPSDLVGLSKVSVQTGTSHGGKMNSDGSMEEMKVDFQVIENLSKLARTMGMAGVVQHGASTLRESMFGQFPNAGAIEIHLSTGWQNMILDHPQFPADLKSEMYQWVKKVRGSEMKEGENENQFLYRMRKFAWGEFREKLLGTSQEFKTAIKDEMKKRCIELYKVLKVAGTQGVVEKYISQEGESVNQIKSVEQADVSGKRVLVRVDWNVTQGKALQIIDDTRIVRTLPTINWLLDKGASQVILMSHLGKAEEKRSLKSVVEYAQNLIGEPIKFVSQLSSFPVSQSRLIMLENLRLWEGEEKNESEFAKSLAQLGDIYVNEAFGESHREAASIVGITKYLPSYGGMWLRDEVETILNVRNDPTHPYAVIMGGAKVEDKIKLIQILSESADVIMLGGKLANEYVERGMKVTGKARIITPIEGSELKDIGIQTQQLYAREIANAKTIIWNGPMGMVEDPQFRFGTKAIYEALVANTEAYTLVGGGDTLASIAKDEQLNRIDHVSTGGGAMLKLLEAGSLVGIEVLKS